MSNISIDFKQEFNKLEQELNHNVMMNTRNTLYELMKKHYYPKNKVIFSTFSTFSRYGGPREALFTAICRKYFGCSHFIVGRDHTGVGDFYHPHASHMIFDNFLDLGIKPVKFDKVFYSEKINEHVHEKEDDSHEEEDKLHISGTQARKMFENQETPPEWFIRSRISSMIIDSVRNNEEVFVKEQNKGKVIWFTGLSGSGKSTIANSLKEKLEFFGKSVIIVDGDIVRNSFNKHLGFSREDIRENNSIISEICKEHQNKFDYILVPIISPFKEDRQMASALIGEDFIELFINSSLEVCKERDVKGLYKKAVAGEIENFIGISAPYEAPENPNISVKTDEESLDESIDKITGYLKNSGLLQNI